MLKPQSQPFKLLCNTLHTRPWSRSYYYCEQQSQVLRGRWEQRICMDCQVWRQRFYR